MRTKIVGAPGWVAARASASRARVRAAALAVAATESSRSRISASAPLASAFSNLRGESAGTKSSERMGAPLVRLSNVNVEGVT